MTRREKVDSPKGLQKGIFLPRYFYLHTSYIISLRFLHIRNLFQEPILSCVPERRRLNFVVRYFDIFVMEFAAILEVPSYIARY